VKKINKTSTDHSHMERRRDDRSDIQRRQSSTHNKNAAEAGLNAMRQESGMKRDTRKKGLKGPAPEPIKERKA
jgi:hypothetical protein